MRGMVLIAALVLSCACLAQAPAPAAKQFPFGPATEKQVDAIQVLSAVEADIKDLIAQNEKKQFSLTPSQQDKARYMLAAQSRAIGGLKQKYRRVKDPVDAAPLYDEIEVALEKSGGGDKLLMLALKGKDTPQTRRCDNFCWKECGPNHVGDWGCFLTCQRHC